MTENQSLTIVIQAGGQSSRMGQDKALMPFLGRPLIVRLVERLRSAQTGLWLVANRPEAYEFLGLPVVSDRVQGQGPLGGLLTALASAPSDLVGVVACDMPFLNPALLLAQARLLIAEGVDVVVPRSPEGLEPLHAIYRRDVCLPAVQMALEAGKRRMIGWFETVKVRELQPEEAAVYDPLLRSFVNVNTPDEFSQAERWAAAEGS